VCSEYEPHHQDGSARLAKNISNSKYHEKPIKKTENISSGKVLVDHYFSKLLMYRYVKRMFQYPPSSSFSRHLAKPDRVIIRASLSSLLGSQVTSREANSLLNMKKCARDEPL